MEHNIEWYKKKVKELRKENKELKLYILELHRAYDELQEDFKWSENEIKELYYYLNY